LSYPRSLRKHAELEIDLDRALAQHAALAQVLESLGVHVSVLDPSEPHPDAVFVEDTALRLGSCALLLRPAPPSRRGEPAEIADELARWIAVETFPGRMSVEGGDCIDTPEAIFLGVRRRTDREAAHALAQLAGRRSVVSVDMRDVDGLHLKTVATYLGRKTLIADERAIDAGIFRSRGYTVLACAPDEPKAANCVAVGGSILMSSGNPRTLATLQSAGFAVRPVDIGEFEKADGSVSCLMLLIEPRS
jgi:dimethylargininase